MDDKQLPKSSTQRQTDLRERMAKIGKKSLTVGYIDEKYHTIIKELAKDLDLGVITSKTNYSDFVKTVKDKSEINALNVRIDELKAQISKCNGAYRAQAKASEKASKVAEDRIDKLYTECRGLVRANEHLQRVYESVRKIFWRFAWLRKKKYYK